MDEAIASVSRGGRAAARPLDVHEPRIATADENSASPSTDRSRRVPAPGSEERSPSTQSIGQDPAGHIRPRSEAPALRWARSAALLPALALLALIGAYWIVAYHPGSLAYVDYVDGYYLYVAHRMAQGAVLYSQVMGVQPPGIYLVGDALFRLHDSLAVARCYAAALHSLTVLLVFAAGSRLHGNVRAALASAVLYSLAPYSLIWSRTFDPNPLVTCLSLATFVALLGATPGRARLAGLIGALALATKIWYLPVAVATLLFLARRRRDLLRPYAAALVSCTALILALGTLSAGGAFWRGLLVQDASGLSPSWLLAAVFDVLQRDWPLLLLAGAGLALSPQAWFEVPGLRLRSDGRHTPTAVGCGRSPLRILRRTTATAAPQGDDMRRFAQWYLWASALVLGATIKVGTFAPVFQFAEPALALFAAAALSPWLARGAAFRVRPSRGRWHTIGNEPDVEPTAVGVVPAIGPQSEAPLRGGPAIACTILAGLLLWAWPTVAAMRAESDTSVRVVLSQISRASAPGASLLAPPFYLYLSHRREIGEYADVNLWALADARGDAAARALTRRAVADLRRRAIPLVLLDNRVARLPGVVAALRADYHQSPFTDPLPADRAVTLWAPNAR